MSESEQLSDSVHLVRVKHAEVEIIKEPDQLHLSYMVVSDGIVREYAHTDLKDKVMREEIYRGKRLPTYCGCAPDRGEPLEMGHRIINQGVVIPVCKKGTSHKHDRSCKHFLNADRRKKIIGRPAIVPSVGGVLDVQLRGIRQASAEKEVRGDPTKRAPKVTTVVTEEKRVRYALKPLGFLNFIFSNAKLNEWPPSSGSNRGYPEFVRCLNEILARIRIMKSNTFSLFAPLREHPENPSHLEDPAGRPLRYFVPRPKGDEIGTRLTAMLGPPTVDNVVVIGEFCTRCILDADFVRLRLKYMLGKPLLISHMLWEKARRGYRDPLAITDPIGRAKCIVIAYCFRDPISGALRVRNIAWLGCSPEYVALNVWSENELGMIDKAVKEGRHFRKPLSYHDENNHDALPDIELLDVIPGKVCPGEVVSIGAGKEYFRKLVTKLRNYRKYYGRYWIWNPSHKNNNIPAFPPKNSGEWRSAHEESSHIDLGTVQSA